MGFLFGPVSSRRLGLSLGVDLIPPKVCTFDCIYCEIGKTTKCTVKRKEYTPTAELLSEAEEYLRSEAASNLDFVTVTGSGEPTLHSKIELIISRLKEISPKPLAVLTNGSLLYLPGIRKALCRADVILPSLDAVNPDTFQKIDRPVRPITIEKVISGLKDLRQQFSGQIWLEVLFVKGINDKEIELEQMKQVFSEVQPDRIQLNTVDRPPAEELASPLSCTELEKIKEFFGDKAEVVVGSKRQKGRESHPVVETEILAMLARRPCTAEDISGLLNISLDEVNRLMSSLIRRQKAQSRLHNRRTFFVQ